MLLVSFCTPVKTSENLQFYNVFRGYRKESVAWNELMENGYKVLLMLSLLFRFKKLGTSQPYMFHDACRSKSRVEFISSTPLLCASCATADWKYRPPLLHILERRWQDRCLEVINICKIIFNVNNKSTIIILDKYWISIFAMYSKLLIKTDQRRQYVTFILVSSY